MEVAVPAVGWDCCRYCMHLEALAPAGAAARCAAGVKKSVLPHLPLVH